MLVVLPGGQASGSGGSGAVVARALAVSSSTAVCPPGKFLLYLWADAGPADLSAAAGSGAGSSQRSAAEALLPALAALADTAGLQGLANGGGASGADPASAAADSSTEAASSSSRPAALWAAFYTQTSTQLLPAGEQQPGDGSSGGRWPANVALCPGPDGSATCVSAVAAAKAAYWQLFPPSEAAADAAQAGAGAGDAGSTDEGTPAAAPAAPVFPLDPQRRRQQSEEEGGMAAAAGDGAAADADSDDEALAALQAALRQVGAGAADSSGGEQPAPDVSA